MKMALHYNFYLEELELDLLYLRRRTGDLLRDRLRGGDLRRGGDLLGG